MKFAYFLNIFTRKKFHRLVAKSVGLVFLFSLQLVRLTFAIDSNVNEQSAQI